MSSQKVCKQGRELTIGQKGQNFGINYEGGMGASGVAIGGSPALWGLACGGVMACAVCQPMLAPF